MTYVGLSDIACDLGQPVDAMLGWARHRDLDPDFLDRMKRNRVEVFRTARGRPPHELCLGAIDRVLHQTGRDLAGFGGAIHFHSLHSSAPVFGTGYRAALRQRGLPDSAFFFSVSHQRCIGFHLALKLAQARLEQTPDLGDILLFGGDIALDEGQRNIDGLAIESDAASAAIVSRHAGCRVVSTEIRTEGAYFQHDKPFDPRRYQLTAFREILKLIETVLSNGGIEAKDIDSVITHNGNIDMWGRIFAALVIPEEKHFRTNYTSIGHTNCSDFPINLMTFIKQSRPEPGSNLLVLAIAYGRSFGCSLLRT
jgi:hypothetical protein